MFATFDEFSVPLGDVEIAGRISRDTEESRPPLLLLHGHPESHLMWHRIADRLAEHYTVIIPDLRGYGSSGIPAADPDHHAYSKRTMARDQVLLMQHFGAQRGFEKFAVCAHDRGARVAHRLIADHPSLVSAAMLLDIAPTLDMYASTNRAFAERCGRLVVLADSTKFGTVSLARIAGIDQVHCLVTDSSPEDPHYGRTTDVLTSSAPPPPNPQDTP
ncbi:MAG: alpha/beta fold hydrolase [Actinomycetes bacterium]